MHILFVDESGTAPPPGKVASEPTFVLGGIIIPEDVWPKIRADLDLVKSQFNIAGEIKWKYFAPHREGARTHSMSHLSAEQKNAVRAALLAAVIKYKSIRLIACVIDTAGAYGHSHINNADDLYHEAFKQLSERFQYFLQDLERVAGIRVNGMIVCDNRNNDQDDRLKEFHQSLLTGRGRFTSSYTNLIEGLFIAASHHSPGTQFADLVVGSIFRAEARNDARYFDVIEPALRRSSNGVVRGFGLVYIPHGSGKKS